MPKYVEGIKRSEDLVTVDYQNDYFKKWVDDDFQHFDKVINNLKIEVQKCLDSKAEKPEYARVICLGDKFSQFYKRFTFAQFKIQSIYENMIDLLITQNCYIYTNATSNCNKIRFDVRMLSTGDYDILPILDDNKFKYIDNNLPLPVFNQFFTLLVYVIEKYEAYKKTLASKKLIMEGQLWMYYQDNILAPFQGKTAKTDSQSQNDDVVNEYIISGIFQKFQDENKSLREYISIEGIPNPFETEDELEDLKKQELVDKRFQDGKKKAEGRFTKQIHPFEKIDCSRELDYNICIRAKIKQLFKEDQKNKVSKSVV